MTCKDCYHDGIGCCFTGVEEVEKICKHFKERSTVAEVVHGRWNVGGVCPWNDVVGNWKCSVCGGVSLKDSAYCPNCGAKMDLEVQNGND